MSVTHGSTSVPGSQLRAVMNRALGDGGYRIQTETRMNESHFRDLMEDVLRKTSNGEFDLSVGLIERGEGSRPVNEFVFVVRVSSKNGKRPSAKMTALITRVADAVGRGLAAPERVTEVLASAFGSMSEEKQNVLELRYGPPELISRLYEHQGLTANRTYEDIATRTGPGIVARIASKKAAYEKKKLEDKAVSELERALENAGVQMRRMQEIMGEWRAVLEGRAEEKA